AGSWRVLQGILLRAIDRRMVVAAHARIHKLDVDVVADSCDIAVVPRLKREGRGVSATLLHRTLIASARRMRINRVWFAERDIDMPAVRHPSRLARRKMLVRISDARVVLVPEFIIG